MTRLPVVVSTKTSGKFNCLWGLYCNVAISDKDVSYIRRPRCNSYTTLGTLQPAVCNSIFNHTRVTSHNKRMTRGVHPMIAIKMNRFRNAIFPQPHGHRLQYIVQDTPGHVTFSPRF